MVVVTLALASLAPTSLGVGGGHAVVVVGSDDAAWGFWSHGTTVLYGEIRVMGLQPTIDAAAATPGLVATGNVTVALWKAPLGQTIDDHALPSLAEACGVTAVTLSAPESSLSRIEFSCPHAHLSGTITSTHPAAGLAARGTVSQADTVWQVAFDPTKAW